MSVLYFLLLIGVLVLIHELGHFAAAKLLDFKVTRFSLGFGRPLLRVVSKETEYQLGIFPLGGYVRIAGEDPEDRGGEVKSEDRGRSFDAKPMWQRLIVVFAGPVANLLLPIAIYFSLFVGHTKLPAAVVGDVFDGSPAERAGVQSGDRIVAIDGEGVRYWEEVERIVAENPGEELKFKIKRGDQVLERYIEPTTAVRKGPDGRRRKAGVIGITRAPFLPQVGVVDGSSSAARAGLQNGDIVIALDGRRIETDRRLATELAQAKRRGSHRTHLAYLRGTSALPGITLLAPATADLMAPSDAADRVGVGFGMGFGMVPADLVVVAVSEQTPAAEIGLRAGDVVVSAGGDRIHHWVELRRRLAATGTEPIELVWQRSGGGQSRATLTQRRVEVIDAFGHRSTELVFGARSRYALGRGESVAISDRFRYAAGKAIERTGETISVVGAAFWSIVRGRSPREELGGPITMYRAAAVSGERGWISFLLIIALISISVALINLLPIPVLDGGHLLIFAIESIRGERLSKKGHARFAIAGYSIVGLFTVLALGNDVLRYFFK